MKPIHWIIIIAVVLIATAFGTVAYRKKKAEKESECSSCNTDPKDTEVVIQDPTTGQEYSISLLGENQNEEDAIIMSERAKEVVTKLNLMKSPRVILKVYNKNNKVIGVKEINPAIAFK